MDLTDARKLVIKAGKELVSSGLIARTWGNVSCRVDETTFVITPSGRNYLTLSEEEIVAVNQNDLTYSGDILPSSEMRIHAGAYRLNPKTRFIIHTHQEKASIVSALGLSAISVSSPSPELGTEIPCAEYALPGTKALAHNTIEALKRASSRGVILKHHGVLCAGESYEEAFRTAFLLEAACGDYLAMLLVSDTDLNVGMGANSSSKPDDGTDANSSPRPPAPGCGFLTARRAPDGFLLNAGADSDLIKVSSSDGAGPYPSGLETECALCAQIYGDHPSINYIQTTAADCARFPSNAPVLATWIDDFAQMIGPELAVLPANPAAVSRSLKSVSAALIEDAGALCCGQTESDASAVRQLLEKNCKAFRASLLLESASPVSRPHANFMRQNYLKDYSRRF